MTSVRVEARNALFVRNGTRPRLIKRQLVSKKRHPTFDAVLSAITETVKLDSGAVRKIYSSQKEEITDIQDLLKEENNFFFAFGSEHVKPDDLILHPDELKGIQAEQRALKKPITQCSNEGTFYNQIVVRSKIGRLSRNKCINNKSHTIKRHSIIVPTIPGKLILNYKVGEIIGEGNFAEVRLCVDKKTNTEHALKIIDKSKVANNKDMLENEVSILRVMNHSNIIRLLAEFDTPNHVYLVMELVKGGDLFDAIVKHVKFPESDAQIMIHDLACALSYLHENGILHGDIKPENLLVEMEGAHCRLLKVGDFGLAQRIDGPLYAVCGTPTYVAPEVLTEKGYGFKIDIWAAGVILYILLCGFPPFISSTNNQDELFDDILSGQYSFPSPYWDHVTDLAKDLITNMLQSDTKRRYSADEVLYHIWLEEL